MNEILAKENRSIKFNSPIGMIDISSEKNLYNAIRKKYTVLAIEAKRQFEDFYAKYSNCNDIEEKCSADFLESLSPIVEEMQKDLISIGRYDLDSDTIYKYIYDNNYISFYAKALDPVLEQIATVNDNLEAQRQYRQERKDNRSRWVGGSIGGGIIDDYAHQASIGMRNAAEGAAHGIANAVGNSMSKMSANAELSKLFSDPSTKSEIVQGVFLSARGLHLAVIRLCEEFCDDFNCSFPSKEECATAVRLLNNMTSGVVPDDKKCEIFKKILELNPYDFELFDLLVCTYGDQSGELATLGEYYGIDMHRVKERIALDYLEDLTVKTEEEAKAIKDELIDICKTIGLSVTDDLDCIKYIDKILADFDLEYRTVEGVECSTRDAADFARGELKEIQAFMANIQAPTLDSLLDYEVDLLEKKTTFEQLFTSELKEKYLKQINDYLNDFDKKFCMTRIFKTVDRKQAGKDRLLKMVKKLDTSSIEKIDEAYVVMESLLPKLGLVKEDTEEVVQFLEKRKTNLLSLKSKSKTFSSDGQKNNTKKQNTDDKKNEECEKAKSDESDPIKNDVENKLKSDALSKGNETGMHPVKSTRSRKKFGLFLLFGVLVVIGGILLLKKPNKDKNTQITSNVSDNEETTELEETAEEINSKNTQDTAIKETQEVDFDTMREQAKEKYKEIIQEE